MKHYIWKYTVAYGSSSLLLGDREAIWLVAELVYTTLDFLNKKVGIN